MFECNGLGTILCLCGGDLCVCKNNGEIQCDGCDACRPYPDDECTCYEAHVAHMPGCAYHKTFHRQRDE